MLTKSPKITSLLKCMSAKKGGIKMWKKLLSNPGAVFDVIPLYFFDVNIFDTYYRHYSPLFFDINIFNLGTPPLKLIQTLKIYLEYLFWSLIRNFIVEKGFQLQIFSRWPPEDTNPTLYLNRGVRSLFFALKPECSTSFPIGQLTYVLEREKAKTLIKIEFDEERIVEALRNSENIKDRVKLCFRSLMLNAQMV